MDKMDLILNELVTFKKEVNEKFDKMDVRLAKIEEDIDDLKEGQEEIRTACNVLIDWAEKASEARDLPLPKIG